ncbi:MAG: sensor histidine kinase [Bacteroidota bacterium]
MFDRFDTSHTHTHFASSKRNSREEIYRQSNKIARSDFLENILSNIPLIFLIINEERQIIYSNKILVKNLGYEKLESVLGLRPGEMFRCIHSQKEKGGCGTNENCRYCGAVNSILESKKRKETVTKECRLSLAMGSEVMAANYEMASTPFFWEGESFYIVAMKDISDKKRREQLERVFFHDLINKAGSLSGLVELIKDKETNNKSRRLLDYVDRGMKELLNDIIYQRHIQQAEKGKLKIKPVKLKPLNILNNIHEDFKSTLEREKKNIEIDRKTDDIDITSDKVLLNRVLTNLVKNALEACLEGDVVKMKFSSIGQKCSFTVSNPSVMSEEVKSQIFQRSFSTKGSGRGIGTYSIKLFTESYLKGKVSFVSDVKTGTNFRIDLPVDIKEDHKEAETLFEANPIHSS